MKSTRGSRRHIGVPNAESPYKPLEFPKDGIGDILRQPGIKDAGEQYFPEPSYDFGDNPKTSTLICSEVDKRLCRGKMKKPSSGEMQTGSGALSTELQAGSGREVSEKTSSKSKRSTRSQSDQAGPTHSSEPTLKPQTARPVYKMPPAFTHNGEVPDRARQRELEEFYKNYNAMEGLVTAIVLGGFFVFVSLLVLYKTKCKPMWKNRGKRLTNTPATHSMGENETSAGQHPGPTPTCTINGEILQSDGLGGGGGDGGEGDAEGDYDADDDQHLEMGDTFEEEDFEFECIPLKSVFTMSGEDEDEEDVYFLDEFGNYVFPVTATTGALGAVDSVTMRTVNGSVGGGGGSSGGGGGGGGGGCGTCSCGPQLGDQMDLTTSIRRRQSQASALSNGYTVKSLPGASYLYIPVLDTRSVSLTSVGRSLSDPEIHFSSPLSHPMLLTVNPTTESQGSMANGSSQCLPSTRLAQQVLNSRPHHKLQQRSHSIQPGESGGPRQQQQQQQGQVPRGHYHGINPSTFSYQADIHKHTVRLQSEESLDCNDMIAIQIIGATPNISPSCSLRSFSGDSQSPDIIPHVNFGGTDMTTTGTGSPGAGAASTSPTSSLKKQNSSHLAKPFGDRRVSFSEDNGDSSPGTAKRLAPPHQTGSGSSSGGMRPPSIPCMNYLQVPGQPPALSFVVPSTITPEAKLAQTSPQARRRRATRLMKVGSFCSIASDGDGDIFGPNGELLSPTKISLPKEAQTEERGGDCKIVKGGGGGGGGGGGAGTDNEEEEPLLSRDAKNDAAFEYFDTRSSCSNRASPLPPTGERQSRRHSSKSSFDPLSEYSEFFDECRSDISDMFSQPQALTPEPQGALGVIGSSLVVGGAPMEIIQAASKAVLQAQGTLSDQGSIKSLSLDRDDDAHRAFSVDDEDPLTTITDKLPGPLRPYNNPEYDLIMQRAALLASNPANENDGEREHDGHYASSSCSLSMGSEGDLSHQITVPVTIEPPPPNMRPSLSEPGRGQTTREPSPDCARTGGERESELGCVVLATLAKQETLHTDSGLDTDDIMPSSQPVAELEQKVESSNICDDEMVLVRDIGVQVSDDSPNLSSSPRRAFSLGPVPASCSGQRSASTEALRAPTQAALTQQSSLQSAFPERYMFGLESSCIATEKSASMSALEAREGQVSRPRTVVSSGSVTHESPSQRRNTRRKRRPGTGVRRSSKEDSSRENSFSAEILF